MSVSFAIRIVGSDNLMSYRDLNAEPPDGYTGDEIFVTDDESEAQDVAAEFEYSVILTYGAEPRSHEPCDIDIVVLDSAGNLTGETVQVI